MTRKRYVVLVVALAFAGCTDDDETAIEHQPSQSAPAAPSTSSSTTTTAPTTTAEPVSFDVEVRRAAVELLELRNEIFQNPDPERADEFLSPSCTCYSETVTMLQNLVAQGERWDGPAVEPIGIRLLDDDPVIPRTVVILRQRPIRVVDANGAVVEEIPELDLVAFSVGLQRDDRGEWRIDSLLNAEQFDRDLAEDILAEGLP